MLRRLAILGVIVAAVVVAIVLIAAGGDDHSVPAGSVAQVGDKQLTKPEFDHWITVVSAVQRPPKSKKPPTAPKPGTPEYKQTAQQVMQFLVSSLWIEGEAADRGITATPQEVKQQFKQTRTQSFPTERAYQRFLKQTGQTQADIDYRVLVTVLSDKIRQQLTRDTTTVSDDDIKNYYDQNAQQFSQPERRDLRIILTKSQAKAQEALKRVQSGEDFKKVAKALSEDPATKDQGGQLLGITKGQQETDFDTAIFAAPKGKVDGPVKTGQGYYVFEVTKITPATKQSLAQSKEGIRQLLISQKQQQELDAFTQGFRKKWRGKTDCIKALVIPDCSNGKEPDTGLAGGAAALSGAGQPAALGGAQTAAATPGLPGATPGSALGGAGGAAAGGAVGQPAALSGSGQAAALGGAAATGLPQGVVPQGAAPQGGAPQGSVPQGAAPQGGAPQGGAPQGGAPQGGAPQGGAAPPGG